LDEKLFKKIFTKISMYFPIAKTKIPIAETKIIFALSEQPSPPPLTKGERIGTRNQQFFYYG